MTWLLSPLYVSSVRSATQAEAFNQALISGQIAILEISEQALALVDQLEQAAAGVVILLVRLEMIGEVIDAGGQQGNLHFRRAGVVRRAAEVSNDLAGLFCGEGHVYLF